ncbi:hypothetical protein VTJ83DRAFT_3972 [Remersonia thermophila]|uniref:methionyl-tRNA formyltransferase n=1 Tax=Remersonia thermophila TaxID=72144 RepID=A0ABR4DFL6_9PEZI
MLLVINRGRLASSACLSQAKLRPGEALLRPLQRRVASASTDSIRSYSNSSPSSWQRPCSDPLRILFCGSDHFSCASLRALHKELRQGSDQDGGGLIRSIDVVVRPAKPTGRGYKVLREVPLRILADELGFPVHERDTFRGWDMPRPDGDPINLIIAVSFGLFVPPRLIHAAKYGGLNVHPSFLPDLRGPAPIHHAFLLGRPHTGVTIQTLSPASFDAGVPLMQTPRPGIPVPDLLDLPGGNQAGGEGGGGAHPFETLHNQLAAEGARMLVETLKRGLHVPPYRSCLPGADEQNRARGDFRSYAHAPKITPADKQLPLVRLARAAAVRSRVLGPLWARARVRKEARGKKKKGGQGREGAPDGEGARPSSAVVETKRVIFEDLEPAAPRPEPAKEGRVRWVVQKRPGSEGGEAACDEEYLGRYLPGPDKTSALVQLHDGSWLRVGRIKVEGSTSQPALSVLESLRAPEE